jgi:hypothetical protein
VAEAILKKLLVSVQYLRNHFNNYSVRFSHLFQVETSLSVSFRTAVPENRRAVPVMALHITGKGQTFNTTKKRLV